MYQISDQIIQQVQRMLLLLLLLLLLLFGLKIKTFFFLRQGRLSLALNPFNLSHCLHKKCYTFFALRPIVNISTIDMGQRHTSFGCVLQILQVK